MLETFFIQYIIMDNPKIHASFLKDTNEIKLSIKFKEKEFNFTRTLTSANLIKFTLTHPSLEEKIEYHALLENSKLYFYPLFGPGALTDSPVPLND